MSKKKLTALKSQLAKLGKQIPYRQPEVYSLGSLEKVQSYYDGYYSDGPSSSYWYDG